MSHYMQILNRWLYDMVHLEIRQESFINELVDHYIQKYPTDQNGKIHVHMVRLEAGAVKTV